jgi:hypothetical protein
MLDFVQSGLMENLELPDWTPRHEQTLLSLRGLVSALQQDVGPTPTEELAQSQKFWSSSKHDAEHPSPL